MFESVLVVLGEFLIQVVAEALIQLGFHSLAEPLQKAPNPWLTAISFTLFGAVFGGFSLLAFPTNLVPQSWRLINLLITPLAVGGIMALLGVWAAERFCAPHMHLG